MIIHLVKEVKENIDPIKEYIDENYIKRSKKVYNSYCNHVTNSLRIASTFGIGSVKMLIHAFIPDLFQKSTSECLSKIHEDLENNSSKFSKRN